MVSIEVVRAGKDLVSFPDPGLKNAYLVKVALLVAAELGFRIPLELVKLNLRQEIKVGRKRYIVNLPERH